MPQCTLSRGLQKQANSGMPCCAKLSVICEASNCLHPRLTLPLLLVSIVCILFILLSLVLHDLGGNLGRDHHSSYFSFLKWVCLKFITNRVVMVNCCIRVFFF